MSKLGDWYFSMEETVKKPKRKRVIKIIHEKMYPDNRKRDKTKETKL